MKFKALFWAGAAAPIREQHWFPENPVGCGYGHSQVQVWVDPTCELQNEPLFIQNG